MPEKPHALTFSPEDFEPPPPPRHGFGKFLRDVIILLALGGGGMYLYREHVATREKVEAIASEARNHARKNDLAALMKAERGFLEALELDPDDGRVAAALAETYLFMHATHGLDTLSKVSRYLSQAETADTQSPTRFAVAAYLKIAKGQPEAAERMVKDLLDQDKSAPVLAHALGWALMEQGDYIEGNRVMDSATDADFSAVAYRMTLADGSLRQGSPKAAIKHLSSVVRSNMNPEHDLARAYLAALRLQTYGNLTTPSKLIDELDGSKREKGPRTEGYTHWAKAERLLAVGNPDEALKVIGEAKQAWPEHPPFLGLEARAHQAKGDATAAIGVYERAIAMEPLFRGLKWDLARLKSEKRDDAALTLVAELEKSHQGFRGPEYEVFRGHHALRKGDLRAARASFTQAAELGDDPEILLGLARVAFAEESKKGRKADLDKVAEPLQRAMDARKYFPEAQEFYGDVNLWNFLVDGAHAAFSEAEEQFKRLKRPIPEVLSFYDRVVRKLKKVEARKLRRKANKLADQWAERKTQYIASLVR